MSRFNQRSSKKSHSNKAQSYADARPMETLEGRQMFTVTPMFFAPNTLTFVGDAANDTVNLYDNGNGGISGSYTNAGGTLTPLPFIPGIQNIRVSTGSGNDTVNYQVYGDMLLGGARFVTVDLGKGDDVSRFYAANDIDMGPNAYFAYGVYGTTGRDYIEALYYGELDGQLRLNLDGGYDEDQIVTRAKMQVGSGGVFYARSWGGDGDDSIHTDVRRENPFDPVAISAGIDGGNHVFGDKAVRNGLVWDVNVEFLTVIP